MKTYKINQMTAEQWSAIEDEYEFPQNEILIVWHEDRVCMDITADGVRIVPILRKIEASLAEAGLAGSDGTFAGWFGQWADDLRDPIYKKYFIWNYSGAEDLRNGCWSYSWGIEDQDGQWYVFLNLVRPKEEQPEEDPERVTAEMAEIRRNIDQMPQRSAWDRGVTTYALELVDGIEEAITGGWFDLSDLASPAMLRRQMLNGAADWSQYSWGGCSLIYNRDIAERLCTPSELTKTRHGERRPNAREEWLDVQCRALSQAAERVQRAVEQSARKEA